MADRHGRNTQQDLCADWLSRFIDEADPEVVVAFGGKALEALGRLECHGLKLSESAGKLHPWRGRHLLALYHPGRLGRVTRPEAAQREDISVLGEFLAGDRRQAATSELPPGGSPDSARLVLRAQDGSSYSELAFRLGAQLAQKPVLAFQVPLPDGPPFWRGVRMFVEGTVKRGDKTAIVCRHEDGISEVEVHPLTEDERAAILEWTESLPEGALEAMREDMDAMLDPRAL